MEHAGKSVRPRTVEGGRTRLLLTVAVGLVTLTFACAKQAYVAPVSLPPVSTQTPFTRVAFASLDADLTNGIPTALTGYLLRPSGPGPFAAVVALHGCAGLFLTDGSFARRDSDWALRLRELSYVVLLPDSFNSRGIDEICTRSQRMIRPGYERARDAYGALRYLQALPFIRKARVALVGWSNGGVAVLSTLAASLRARPTQLASDFRTAIAFYPACERTLDRPDWLPLIAPLTILIGGADNWTPAEPCVALGRRANAAGANVEVVVYPQAFHDFDAPTMPIHTIRNLATTDTGAATLGTDPAARADAILRVTHILMDALHE
jgi:dienelactone hydrolase